MITGAQLYNSIFEFNWNKSHLLDLLNSLYKSYKIIYIIIINIIYCINYKFNI